MNFLSLREFAGAVYSAQGLKPDPLRTQEIYDLPEPTNKHDLVISWHYVYNTYLASFISHFSDMTALLRSLTKKESELSWTATHIQSFKDAISSASTLHYFNPEFVTKVLVDSSQKGLGAALLQVDPKEPDRVCHRPMHPRVLQRQRVDMQI